MTFLTLFRTVAKDLGIAAGVAQQLAPVVTAFNPAAGALMSLVSSAVLKAETLFPAPQSGPLKKASVMDYLMQSLALAVAMSGKPIPPDAEEKLSSAVDSIVSVLNSVNHVTTPAPAG